MGEVKKQSVLSTIFLAFGVVIGFFNTVILLPWVLTTEQIGLIRIVVVVASIFNHIAQFGVPGIVLRYFPHFKDDQKRHHDFLFLVTLLPVIPSLIAVGIVFLSKPSILDFYEQSRHLVDQFYLMIPILLLALTFFNVYFAYAQSHIKTAIPNFLRNVFMRLSLTVMVFLFYLGWINYSWLVQGFVASYVVQLGLIFLFIWYIGQLMFRPNWKVLKSSYLKEMLTYSGYVVFSGSAYYITTNLDALMVSWLSEGEVSDVGIYTTFMYVGVVIALPATALIQTTLPLISRALKNNDIKTVESLYKKTSINTLTIGLLIYVGVVANLLNLLDLVEFAGKGKYAAGMLVPVFIGLGRLVDIAFSVNGGIIIFSKFFRFELVLAFILLLLTIVTNYLAIPFFGLIGAAIATMLTLMLYNFVRGWFIYHKFGIHPFSKETLKVVGVAGCILALNFLLPRMDFFLVDVLIRSLLITLAYCSAIYYFKLVPDLQQLVIQMLNRFWSLFRKN